MYNIREEGQGDGKLNTPWGLCVQKCGDHHNLVCNAGNGGVDQFAVEGCFTEKTVDTLQEDHRNNYNSRWTYFSYGP